MQGGVPVSRVLKAFLARDEFLQHGTPQGITSQWVESITAESGKPPPIDQPKLKCDSPAFTPECMSRTWTGQPVTMTQAQTTPTSAV